MKLKVLTTCHNDGIEGYRNLKASLDKHGYDYACLVRPFRFGHQLPIIQDWCNYGKDNYTHILYTDAFDTLAFAPPEEVIEKFLKADCKMFVSCEKNCYPHPERAEEYPYNESAWRYVNGGGWMTEIDYFKEICIKEKLNDDSHDQVWLMETFLNNQDNIKLDSNCEIFQTIAFSHKDEWKKDVCNMVRSPEESTNRWRFRNIGTNTTPVFFHGNGHTDMEWLNS